jgi:hypothetical protein
MTARKSRVPTRAVVAVSKTGAANEEVAEARSRVTVLENLGCPPEAL